MDNLLNSVYSSLKKDTAEISDKLALYNAFKNKETSGRYTEEYLNAEVRPKMFDLKREIERDKEAAIANAKGIVRAFQAEIRDKDNLHPEDITEDAKLFSCGVKLTARDIEAILSRNKGNGTMEQLAFRYAEENGVDLGGRRYIGHQTEIQTAGSVEGTINYYARWIDKPTAEIMLDKFFPGMGEDTEAEE